MRTADKILRDLYGFSDIEIGYPDSYPDCMSKGIVIKAINEARKEAIEECAERAEILYDEDDDGNMVAYDIDKQSILSLINEIK